MEQSQVWPVLFWCRSVTCHRKLFFKIFPLFANCPSLLPAASISAILGQIFSEFGIPDMFISDSSAHFSRAEFRSFIGKCNFDHITSSLKYPKSNGFIEHQVEMVKCILCKSKSAGNDFHLALPAWHSTPVSSTLASPSQLLLGRKEKKRKGEFHIVVHSGAWLGARWFSYYIKPDRSLQTLSLDH